MRAKKVMIVEDSFELRTLYKDIFTDKGFEVVEAPDGQIAIDYALMHKPDAIILDLMMPRQGGLGALRIFRTHPDTKNIPIIIMTALENPEYKEYAKDKVQGFYLKTELKPAQLVEKVRELLPAE